MYELTQAEKDAITGYAKAFWDDIRVMQYQNAVVLYVEGYRSSFEYVCCLGVYDNPLPVVMAVLASREYLDRSLLSARRGDAMNEDNMQPGTCQFREWECYGYESQASIEEKCEQAIAGWYRDNQS
jgi:hypothetical protein